MTAVRPLALLLPLALAAPLRAADPWPQATPTVVGGKAYCLFPRGELVCLSVADGKLVWKANILETAGVKERSDEVFYWGLSASPLVEGDAVIVQPGGDKDNSVLAL